MGNLKTTFFFALLGISTVLGQSTGDFVQGSNDAARPKTSSEIRNNLLGEFFKVSDTRGGIRAFWTTVFRQIQFMPPRDKSGVLTKVELTTDDTRSYAIEFLLQNYNEDLVRQANLWYARPETIKLYTLLTTSYDGYLEFVAEYRKQPPTKLRRELILRLSSALYTVQQAKALFELNGLAVGTITTKLSETTLSSNNAALYDVAQWDIQESALLRLFFCFRDMSDEDLALLVVNMELPIGQWASAYTRGALLASVSRTIQDLRYRLSPAGKKSSE